MNKERYYRQTVIREVGEEGQRKLARAKVLIVGVGGLGSPVSLYLAAAGVKTLGLLDEDKVDLSNLQRQIIHSTSRLNQNKVDSAKSILEDLNPEVNIIPYVIRLDESNAKEIIKEYDVVVSAVDNLETRYLLNKICIELQIPLVEGGVYNFDGVVHTIIKGMGPCYNCIYPQKKTAKRIPGVIGPIVGIVGSFEALEVIKIILNVGKLLTDRMLIIDGITSSVTELEVSCDPDCPICSG